MTTRFQKVLVAAIAATLALIGVGGFVRASGSGLGCSGWPKCTPARWLPPIEYHALIEYSHRMLATVVVVLVAVVAVMAWRQFRREPRVFRPAMAAVVVVFLQAALGGIVVNNDLQPTLVTAHFATAMVLLALLVFALTNSYCATATKTPAFVPKSFSRLTKVTAAATFALMLVGAYVRGQAAGLAFSDWPLMNGKLVPALGGIATAQFVHRVLAALVTMLVLYVFIRSRTLEKERAIRTLSTATLVLFVAQVFAGALNVWTQLSTAAVVAHVLLSAMIWGTVLALAVVSSNLATRCSIEGIRAKADAAAGKGKSSVRDTAGAYFQLTKPRIIVLLLITTVPAMILAAGRVPSVWLILATLLGGTLAAGSANSINCYLDRDIDEIMRRTRKRPLPSHQVTPDRALAFGFVLGAISFLFLSIVVNVLAAVLALAAIVFYVFVYTMWLKRTSEQNIVVGGAAGAVPALVGWAAVTGAVGLPAVLLFGIVFLWTPPHFWALAMQYQGDYAAAGVPMMPVVRGREETLTQMLVYALVTFGATLALYFVAHMGPLYLAAAVVLGGLFVYRTLALRRNFSSAAAMGLFKYSIVYLGLLFAAVAADSLVR